MLLANGIEVEFYLDTGASVTVLTVETYQQLEGELTKPTCVLLSADGKNMNVLGELSLKLSNKSMSITTSAFVVHGASRNLLGVGEINSLGLLKLVNSVCTKAFDPFVEFKELFDGLGTMPGEFEIELKENVRPVHLYAPKSIPAGWRDKAKSEIDKMLKLGVIELVEEPTDWCSASSLL